MDLRLRELLITNLFRNQWCAWDGMQPEKGYWQVAKTSSSSCFHTLMTSSRSHTKSSYPRKYHAWMLPQTVSISQLASLMEVSSSSQRCLRVERRIWRLRSRRWSKMHYRARLSQKPRTTNTFSAVNTLQRWYLKREIWWLPYKLGK